MSVRRYSRIRPKRDDIWQRLGVDRANYAAVVLPPQVGPAIDNGLLCVRPFADVRQNGSDSILSEGSPAAVESGTDVEELACGHPRAYEEAGDCLICDRRFSTREEFEVRTEASSDEIGVGR